MTDFCEKFRLVVLPVINDGLLRLERIGYTRHEVLAQLEVVVDRLRHLEQLWRLSA